MSICSLHWTISPRANCLYAIAGMLSGRQLADDARASELTQHVNLLRRASGLENVDLARLLSHLAPLYATPENTRQVVQTALRKSLGGNVDSSDNRIMNALQDLITAWSKSFPNFETDVNLREAVLEENWAARGPGLLSSIERFTEDELIPSQATVLIVDPLFGGGGAVYLPYNAVAIEAVLANPHAELPEIVRLAWMIAQLQMEAPVLSETIHASKLPKLAALAALPPTLKAAEVVELVQYSPELLKKAIGSWHIPVHDSQLAASTLAAWWEAYQIDRPRWSVGLSALDQMLT